VTLVLDTSVLVDILRGAPAAVTYARELTERICSEVTRVEVIRGLRSRERRGAELMFAEIGWIPVDEEIARRAGELGRRYRRTHPGIGVSDLIIAATAQFVGMELATANTKHFPMFKSLRPPY
jgi:predicted nucleic acid-binding protein